MQEDDADADSALRLAMEQEVAEAEAYLQTAQGRGVASLDSEEDGGSDGSSSEDEVLSVVCPAGVSPGDTLYVQTPDGAELEIAIPVSATNIALVFGPRLAVQGRSAQRSPRGLRAGRCGGGRQL